MSQDCIEIHELSEVLAAPASDPRRRHADRCARCASLLAEYREFADPAGTPQGSNLAEAEARLAALLEREGVAAPRETRAAGSPDRTASGSRMLARVRQWLVLPAARPAFAVAAIVIAGALLVVPRLATPPRLAAPPPGPASAPGGTVEAPPAPGRPGGRAPGQPAETTEPPLRGEPVPGAFALLDPRATPAGIVLEWTAHPRADAYVVVLMTTDLAETGRLGPFIEQRVVLGREDLPAGLSPGVPLLWRVSALRSGDEVAATAPGALRAP